MDRHIPGGVRPVALPFQLHHITYKYLPTYKPQLLPSGRSIYPKSKRNKRLLYRLPQILSKMSSSIAVAPLVFPETSGINFGATVSNANIEELTGKVSRTCKLSDLMIS